MVIPDVIKLLHRAEEAEKKAEAAEDALRDIALFLSCGGYNDVGLVKFDPALYAKKIKETITEQIEQLNDRWGNIVHAKPESEDAFWSQYLEARH
jgi:hypothetical protein